MRKRHDFYGVLYKPSVVNRARVRHEECALPWLPKRTNHDKTNEESSK